MSRLRGLAAAVLVACGAPRAQEVATATAGDVPAVGGVADASHAPPPPDAPALPPLALAGSGPQGCLVEAEVAAAEAQLAARSQAAFEAALAAAGMRRVALELHTWRVTEPGAPPTNPVVRRDPSGREYTMVAIGGVRRHCTRGPDEEYPFARDGDVIYRIERQVTYRDVPLPACPRTVCPSRPACGGALMLQGVGFELPPGTRYGGVRTIAHAAEYPRVDFPQGQGIACVAPKPPP